MGIPPAFVWHEVALKGRWVKGKRSNGGSNHRVPQFDKDACLYDDIEAVIPRAELAAHAEKYKRLSGFSVEILNAQPPILGAG